jgi:2-dehydropantoate 2-reductase
VRIAVVGAGGVGGYYGGLLAAAGEDVGFIARGPHLQAMRAEGLRVSDRQRDIHLAPTRATDDPEEIGPVEVVLFCVKLYDTEAAAALLAPLLGPETILLPLQNGVDSADRLAGFVAADRILPGAAWLYAHVAEPGVVRCTSEKSGIVFGESDGSRSARARRLGEACAQAGIEVNLSTEIEKEVWSKFVQLASNAALSTLSRLNLYHVYRDSDLRPLLEAAMAEAMAVAAAKGIALDDDLIQRTTAQADGFQPDLTNSMHNDLKAGRRLEVAHLSGHIARLGDAFGVPVPIHRAAWAALKPFAGGLIG